MAILPILEWPDKCLRTPTQPVDKITPEIKQLLKDMIDTMYHDKGMGLAANQIGKSLRIFVMDSSPDGKHPLCFINPEIVEQRGEIELEEGCLSFPGVYLKIKRHEFVTLRAMNEHGEMFEMSARDYDARCFLHELDHLNGVTFFDYLSPLKRQIAEKKLTKRRREAM